MKYAPYEYRDLSCYKRVIAVSDIHGDVKIFEKLLKKLSFSREDCLVIAGDLLEKGSECLPLLRRVYELSRLGNVLTVAGNNDVAFKIWRDGEVTDGEMLNYSRRVGRSVLFEMSRELGISFSTVEELKMLKTAIFKEYSELISFLDDLPYIIETNFAVFVHAGLKPVRLTEQEPEYCLSAMRFGEEKHRFPKLVVAGHWPTSNYSGKIISAMPYVNREANTVSIDGGNSLKEWGQLNYLIFRDSSPEYEVGFVDNLPRVRLLDSQEANDPVTLLFPNTRLEKLENGSFFVPYIKKAMDFQPDDFYEYRGVLYAEDYTDYTVPVKPDDEAALCRTEKNRILVKKDGAVGWYYGGWTSK